MKVCREQSKREKTKIQINLHNINGFLFIYSEVFSTSTNKFHKTFPWLCEVPELYGYSQTLGTLLVYQTLKYSLWFWNVKYDWNWLKYMKLLTHKINTIHKNYEIFYSYKFIKNTKSEWYEVTITLPRSDIASIFLDNCYASPDAIEKMQLNVQLMTLCEQHQTYTFLCPRK